MVETYRPCPFCGEPPSAARAATPAATPPEEPIAGGPIIGPLTPKQVRILDNRHHRVKNSRMCACGAVWAYCEVHRLVVTIEDRGAAIPAAPEALREADIRGAIKSAWIDYFGRLSGSENLFDFIAQRVTRLAREAKG